MLLIKHFHLSKISFIVILFTFSLCIEPYDFKIINNEPTLPRQSRAVFSCAAHPRADRAHSVLALRPPRPHGGAPSEDESPNNQPSRRRGPFARDYKSTRCKPNRHCQAQCHSYRRYNASIAPPCTSLASQPRPKFNLPPGRPNRACVRSQNRNIRAYAPSHRPHISARKSPRFSYLELSELF